MSAADRREMLDRSDETLSVRRQCALLGVARSSVYRPERPANDNDLVLMRRIDELFTAWPFYGSRRLTATLRAEGWAITGAKDRFVVAAHSLALASAASSSQPPQAPECPPANRRTAAKSSDPGFAAQNSALSGSSRGDLTKWFWSEGAVGKQVIYDAAGAALETACIWGKFCATNPVGMEHCAETR